MGTEAAIKVLLSLSPDKLRDSLAIRAIVSAGQGEKLAQLFLSLDTDKLLESRVIDTIVTTGHAEALVQRFLRDLDKLSLQQATDLIPRLRTIVPAPASLPVMQDRLAGPQVAQLDDTSWVRRRDAAQALALIGGNRAVQSLKARLAREPDYELQQFLEEMIPKAMI